MSTRSVVVTGANSGIGLLSCLELAEAGYDVIGTARSAEKTEVLERAARDRGLVLRTVVLEVDDAEDCAAVAEQVAGMTGGGPWALVNNAGFARSGAVEDVPDAFVRAQLETNVVAPLRLARLFLPAMRARGEGRIVNMSSIAGRLSVPLLGWYSASKFALEAVSDALRVEVAPDGVQVVLVEPGMFDTDVWVAAQDGGLPPPSVPRYAAAYARSDALASRSAKLPDPVRVARTVVAVLDAPRPLARYLVGADAVGGLVAHTLLPTAVTDLVKSVTTGLRPLPFSRR